MTAISKSETTLVKLNMIKLFVNMNLNFFKNHTKDSIADFMEQNIMKLLKKIEELNEIDISDHALYEMNNFCINESILDNHHNVLRLLVTLLDYFHSNKFDSFYEKLTDEMCKKFGDIQVTMKLSEVAELIQGAEDADFKDFLFGESFYLLKKSVSRVYPNKTSESSEKTVIPSNDSKSDQIFSIESIESSQPVDSSEQQITPLTPLAPLNQSDPIFFEKAKQINQNLHERLRPSLLKLVQNEIFIEKMRSSFEEWVESRYANKFSINYTISPDVKTAIWNLNQSFVIKIFCDHFDYLPRSKIQSITNNNNFIVIHFPDNFLKDVINEFSIN